MKREHGMGALAWLDLEMTGLDPERDVILQAALIITDGALNPLEELCIDIWQPEARIAQMTPFVRDMHEKNGLIARVRSSKVDIRQAEKKLLERIAGWCAYPALLAGNTIGMDRRFVDVHMPALGGYLHYRMLDVTALKLVAQLWYAEDAQFQKSEQGAHDALVDIRNSIAELSHYREYLLQAAKK